MISKAQAKRKQDIKTKLMAAIAMLLVSSIMMVSSTYAWFTLSTAPEVTGITTQVGANGNLEMALLPLNGDENSITSEVGDSNDDIEEKNVTWGNLVDLSDNAVYGLNKITLNPSALNVNSGILAAAMLKTPAYGADGRISALEEKTSTGVFNTSDQAFSPDNAYGVRAVGVSSGMTDRQLDYRNALSAANTAAAQAKNIASQSLNNNGAALADIAIKHGINDGTESYTDEEVNHLKAIVSDLNGEGGVLEKIETAYMQYILAYAASAGTGTEDTTWLAVRGAVNADNATLTSVIAAIGENNLPDYIKTAIAQYNGENGMIAKVTAADTALQSLSGENITWNEINGAMSHLVNVSAMEINGIPASEVKDRIGELAGSMGNGLTVAMKTGGGIYADIADQCGDFTASVKLGAISYQGMNIPEGMIARMVTDSSIEPSYLSAIGTAVLGAGSPPNSGSENLPISEMYGYIIDLAFRTNASESNLLLQQEATDRIYDENTNEETMGHGSSMTFAATTTDFSDEQVKDLMDAIRIVFFTPDTINNGGSVIAYAKLDVVNATLGSDGWEAKIVMINEDGTPKTKEGENSTTVADNTIMALQQNTATAVSVLVYLDGENITNADVAATAATSMTGKMNLQFASSANLVPMEYANLHQPTGSGNGTEVNEYTVTFSGSAGATGNATAKKDQDYTFTLVENHTLKSITVGSTTLTTEDYDVDGSKYTIPAEKVTGNIVIETQQT